MRAHDQVGTEPDYRFSLANERTFLSWIRTALALLAGGVAVVQVLPDFDVPGGREVLGLPLVALSAAIALSSYRHWSRNQRAMRLEQPLPPSPLPLVIGIGVAVVALMAFAFLLAGA